MVTCLDDEIKVVALDRKGLARNTLDPLPYDNGGTRSAMFAGRWRTCPSSSRATTALSKKAGKGTLFEGGSRVAVHAPTGPATSSRW